ncbi:unnamed protein product [Rotaria socialis]|uniref:F-box domain-containing protein n=1 Tax=Rotaria socialis TaxID=392032 RepID=A0A821HQW4_9BILA|nr:unnamed protein product [Rotaria socialis]CAF3515905.1 unnamed protein product [Rotaria socialis]CAF4549783.1 unnamed protein product [Rotaria socialis]CAF4685149.1 unnamed protein product [Rotaria socialis]
MEGSLLTLIDLPDEVLLLILKNLDNIEVLYLFIDLNKRFNKLLHDSIFTNHLTMTGCSFNGSFDRLDNQILDRFCSQILPSIHHNIKWLDVECSSMEDVLLCTSYPYLCGLGLHNIDKHIALRIFTEETPLTHIFQDKISSLVIDVVQYGSFRMNDTSNSNIFANILTLFSKLKYFDYRSSFWYQSLFEMSTTISSSILLELHIKLDKFTDCLYLLDGRFDSLEKVFLDIYQISTPEIVINNKKLPKLKAFSLYSDQPTFQYNELIVPLLHRMANLEQLDLHLVVHCEKRFVDGYNLKYNIINRLLQLNKFLFNIRSCLYLNDQICLLSNEDCQHSFNDFKNNKIISCVDYFQVFKHGQCHIYSYPYRAKTYEYITNNFPGGLFQYVREVSLYDDRPFEHEFFVKIAKSFPFMEQLTIYNRKPQKNKSYEQSKYDNQHLSPIQYPYLSVLELLSAHDDYVEQFLLDIKTSIIRTVNVQVLLSTLDRITQSFTRDATRINCGKLFSIYVPRDMSISTQLKDYFPHTKICTI